MDVDPKEMEEKKKMVLSMCICKDCPTYVECGEAGGYCFPLIGKSGCIKEEKQCICAECPVYSKMGLKHTFYCTRDSEKAQSGA
jgi:hypothetical protein